MKNSLPVRADHIDLRGGNAKFLACSQRGAREYFTEQKIELADFSRGHRAAFAELQNGFLDLRREGKRSKVFERRLSPRHAHQGHVNSVRRRSRHDAERQCAASAGKFHKICFFNSARRLSASTGFKLSISASRSASSTRRSSGVNKACCAGSGSPAAVAPGVNRSLNWCSACSCRSRISRARAITAGGSPAILATSIP